MLLIVALWLTGALLPQPDSSTDIHWQTVTRTAAQPLRGQPPQNDTPQSPVSLPDRWLSTAGTQSGVARYHLTFSWTPENSPSPTLWGLRFQDLSHVHRVWLNGQLLADTLTRPDRAGTPTSQLIQVPPSLLQQGRNDIVLDVWYERQGGLSRPSLAPLADMRSLHLWHDILHRHALLAVNLASFAFSTFVLILWMIRRQEVVVGLFGLLIAISFVRNCSLFVTEDLGIPTGLSSWLYFNAHVLTAVTQLWLVMQLTGRHSISLSHALWVITVSFPLVAAAAVPWDPLLQVTRDLLQPVLISLLLPTLVFLWQYRHRLGIGESHWTLLMTWITVLLCGLHDFIMLRLEGDPAARHWLIWAIPMLMPAFSAMLLARMVHAFDELEYLNQSLEHQVSERTHELAQANLAKSRFLATASHDLRQPVAAIGLMTELLRSKMTDPEQRHLTNQLSSAVVSMETQLRGLLDLSRLDTGEVVVRAQAVSLRPLLRAIQNHEQMTAHSKGLQLRVHLPRQQNGRDLHAWADPVLLEQVLRNLVGNAVRHTQSGGVLIGVRARGNGLRIDVWDTGPGIAPADQQRIFDEFVQIADGVGGGGLGLGLAIARRAAALMNARLELRSRQGRGSCFSLFVPSGAAAIQAPPPPQPSGEVTPEPSPARHTERPIVLLVEDEPPLRLALTLSLQSWGWEVDAHDSISHLKDGANGPWRLLITDYRLPDGLGSDVLAWARAQQPHLPALVITGDTAPHRLKELDALGVPVLHKPFRPEHLKGEIERLLAAHAAA